MAKVKTKGDLETATFRVLDKKLHTKLAMIRVIAHDEYNLYLYMFDRTLFQDAGVDWDKMAAHVITIY